MYRDPEAVLIGYVNVRAEISALFEEVPFVLVDRKVVAV
jgi:hypothetical protein